MSDSPSGIDRIFSSRCIPKHPVNSNADSDTIQKSIEQGRESRNTVICSIWGSVLSSVFFVGVILCAPLRQNPYFRWGYNDQLVIVSMHVNDLNKYCALIFLIVLSNVTSTILLFMGQPKLHFPLFEHSTADVTNFNAQEFLFLNTTANACRALHSLFSTLISVSQIDVALVALVAQQITLYICTCILIKRRNFTG
jgi:hypothetical protein